MPKTTTPASNTRRQRSTRSVTGCLTCRRRKVKCTSRTTPCDPCRRLGLSCDSPLDQNFKSWTSKGDSRGASSPAGNSNSPAQISSVREVATTDVEHGGLTASGHNPGNLTADETRGGLHHDTSGTDLSFNLLDFIFSDLATEIAPMDFNQTSSEDSFFNIDWTTQRSHETQSAQEDPQENEDSDLAMPGLPADSLHRQANPGLTIAAASQTDRIGNNTMFRVPEWLSTKKSIWTCFHYLINSAQAVPNSPLCHAILGWAYAYLAHLNAGPDGPRAEHYGTASAAIRILSQDLSGNAVPSQSLWHGTSRSDLLSLYASSTFFLCQHDLMTGDFDSFIDRLRDAKQIFTRMWAEGTTAGPVECRIFIWLAFLELRFYFLGGEALVDVGAEKDFMTILMELKALPLLRRRRTQNSILSECFGNGLPQEENEEDLRKDRCRAKFDDLMFYLAKCRSFEVWDKRFREQYEAGDEMVRELRQAKVEALEADLRRLQAVGVPSLVMFARSCL